MNVVVEGRERFRLVELTEGRSFQTGLVEPVEDEPARPTRTTRRRRSRLFHRLVELTGAEVEEPSLGSEQLSFELAGRFEFTPQLKQQLLVLTSERERMRLLAQLWRGRGRRRARARDRPARPGQRQGGHSFLIYHGRHGRRRDAEAGHRAPPRRLLPGGGSSTASRSHSSTRPPRPRSRARCSMRCATSTSTGTRTSTAASTGSPSARPRATRARARRSRPS